jgi:hypothetical protein
MENNLEYIRKNENFICENRKTIIEIIKEINEILPQKLPLQRIIMRIIIIPMIDKILQIVCVGNLDDYLRNIKK